MSDFRADRPIYLQLVDEVRKRSARGVYLPGQRLPSVRDFALEMGVNPNTVARAYSLLEQDGFVFTRRGLGCFITEDAERLSAERRRLAERARERFIREIWELELAPKELDDLTRTLREELE